MCSDEYECSNNSDGGSDASSVEGRVISVLEVINDSFLTCKFFFWVFINWSKLVSYNILYNYRQVVKYFRFKSRTCSKFETTVSLLSKIFIKFNSVIKFRTAVIISRSTLIHFISKLKHFASHIKFEFVHLLFSFISGIALILCTSNEILYLIKNDHSRIMIY